MAMTQTTLINPDGVYGSFQTDNAAFRTALGCLNPSTHASGLQVMKFMGGYLWIGAGSPNNSQYAITAYDVAWVLDATTGATTLLRPAVADSSTWQ